MTALAASQAAPKPASDQAMRTLCVQLAYEISDDQLMQLRTRLLTSADHEDTSGRHANARANRDAAAAIDYLRSL